MIAKKFKLGPIKQITAYPHGYQVKILDIL